MSNQPNTPCHKCGGSGEDYNPTYACPRCNGTGYEPIEEEE